MLRFSGFERFVHWMTATSFIVLGLSGLNLSFGRAVLLPLISNEAFTTVSQWGKYAHNYLSVPFALGIVLMFVIWVAHNLPSRVDWNWIRSGGGIVGSAHPPAKKFNAGQKLIFWSVVLGGAALSISGYFLLFPFQDAGIAGMQTAQIVHGVVGIIIVGVILAHIYIGTVGMEGAFDAMGSGEVDENWAREHHSIWYEEKRRKGEASPPPGVPSGVPAE